MSDSQHPLHGAYLRWCRAGEGANEVQTFVEAVKKRHEEVVAYDPKTGAPSQVQYRKPERALIEPSLRQCSIRVGEAVYNLRAALDYLVYELALRDSGQEQEGTQFPLETCKDTFWDVRVKGKRGRFLRGVKNRHIWAIEALQPYKGCQWSDALRDISNPDKHRKLHYVWGQFLPDLWNLFSVVERPDTTPGAESGAVQSELHVNLGITFFVALRDGTAVVQTLQELHAEVGGVLTSFEGEF